MLATVKDKQVPEGKGSWSHPASRCRGVEALEPSFDFQAPGLE